MQFKGVLKAVSRDLRSKRVNIQLELSEGCTDTLDTLADIDLDIELKKHYNHRTRNANALMWMMLGQIAEQLHSEKWEVYLRMLKRYGQYTYICVKPRVVQAVKEQWRECEEIGEIEINGEKAVQMLCYFGSHTYNTKEFTRLLNGIKDEMVEIGIQPPSSEEMQRSLEAWENQQNQS